MRTLVFVPLVAPCTCLMLLLFLLLSLRSLYAIVANNCSCCKYDSLGVYAFFSFHQKMDTLNILFLLLAMILRFSVVMKANILLFSGFSLPYLSSTVWINRFLPFVADSPHGLQVIIGWKTAFS